MTSGKISELGLDEFGQRIAGPGTGVRIGPFNVHIEVPIPRLVEPLFRFYGAYPGVPRDSVYHFRVRVNELRQLPRINRKLVRFSVDGQQPHEDLPADQAWPALEWGINLVIALRAHWFLMLHTAVLEKNGRALLLPAAPGFGKTTLCTALAFRGWRLLSDEFGLIRPGEINLVPIPRPLALKNESIGVIRQFTSDADVGPVVHGTRKGTVAHVKPPVESVIRQGECAAPRWIVFPRWMEGSDLSLERVPKSQGFMRLAMNAFNYEVLGERGFSSVREIVDRSDCYSMVYSTLDEAIDRIDAMAAGTIND